MPRVVRDRQVDDRIAAELAAHADSLSARMRQVTVPIYQEAPPKDPTLVGSGVLVTLADDRFLLTARHVLNWRAHGQLVVGISPEYAGVQGTMWRISADGAQNDSEDYIDLGIVQLRGGLWDTLPLERFCSWNEFDLNPPIMATHTFGMLGFPVSKNRRPIDGDRIKSHALPIAGLECEEETYRAEGRNPITNLMVGYDQKTMSGAEGMRAAPALNGASGGGMWRFGRKMRKATNAPLLSAIFIECHKARHKYIFGTRIQVVIHAMSERMLHVREFVAQNAYLTRTPEPLPLIPGRGATEDALANE